MLAKRRIAAAGAWFRCNRTTFTGEFEAQDGADIFVQGESKMLIQKRLNDLINKSAISDQGFGQIRNQVPARCPQGLHTRESTRLTRQDFGSGDVPETIGLQIPVRQRRLGTPLDRRGIEFQ